MRDTIFSFSKLSSKCRFSFVSKLDTIYKCKVLNCMNPWRDKVIPSMCSSTPCAGLHLVQFKVINRVHFSKSFLQFQSRVTDVRTHPAT